jgi:hypothetical protein
MSTVLARLLPDGSGRLRIHWFVHDVNGPASTPPGLIAENLLSPEMKNIVGPRFRSATGYIACQPKRTDVTPQQYGNEIRLTVHSNDPRAATCPECLATEVYEKAMKELGELVAVNPE